MTDPKKRAPEECQACHCAVCRGAPVPGASLNDRVLAGTMRKNDQGMWEAVPAKVERWKLRRMALSCPTCHRAFGEFLVSIEAPAPTPICPGCIQEGRQPHIAKILGR